MPEATVTREEFRLYHQVQEKGKSIGEIKRSLKWNYLYAITEGLSSAVLSASTTYTLYHVAQGNLPLTASGQTLAAVGAAVAVVVAFNTYGVFDNIRAIVKKKERIGGLEKELEQIKGTRSYENLAGWLSE